MLLHVIILVPKRKEKKKIYIYIYLKTRYRCTTTAFYPLASFHALLDSNTRDARFDLSSPLLYIYTFHPTWSSKATNFFILPRSVLARSSIVHLPKYSPFPSLPSFTPPFRWDANKKETRARKMHRSKKKTNGIDLVVSRDYARAITRKKTNQSIAIRSIKRNHHPGWWTIRLKRKVKEVIYLCSLDGLFYLYIRFLCEGPAIP